MITVMFQVLSGAECSCNQMPHGLPHRCGYSQMYEPVTRDPTLDLGQSQSQSWVTHRPLHFSHNFSSVLLLRREVTSVLSELSVNMLYVCIFVCL